MKYVFLNVKVDAMRVKMKKDVGQINIHAAGSDSSNEMFNNVFTFLWKIFTDEAP